MGQRGKRPPMRRSFSEVARTLKYRKPVTPFICSTFQDFQEERDILVKKAFPAIDEICRARGTYCAPVDLRWGINDAQVNSGQVVTLCLDYVKKCAPFFVCLLGERYGSFRRQGSPPLPEKCQDLAPDADWLDKNMVVAANSGYDWVLGERYQGCSVTELEYAERSLLCQEVGEQFAYYYFRQPDHVDLLHTELPENQREELLRVYEPESEESNLKVREMKAKIVRQGLAVKYFRTCEELCHLVIEDWKCVVDALYPPLFDNYFSTGCDDRVSEWMAHESFAESRRRVFVQSPEIEKLFETLTTFAMSSLEEDEEVGNVSVSMAKSPSFSSYLRKTKPVAARYRSVQVVVGDRGCGKTAVLANWVREFRTSHPRAVRVLTHYVGSSADSCDAAAMMRRFTQELRGEYDRLFNGGADDANDSSVTEDMSDFHQVCEAFHAALTLGPCVLVIDGVDEFSNTYGQQLQQLKEFSWLSYPLPPQCKIILTTVKSDASYQNLESRPDTTVDYCPLLADINTRKSVIRKYLELHCKCLDEDQLQRVVNCRLSDRPLFLSVLANELRVYGVYSRLDYHLNSYLEATSVRDLWSKIIHRWIKDYGWAKVDSTDLANNRKKPEVDNRPDTKGWVADALRLIAVSRHGLSQTEVKTVLERLGYHGKTAISSLDWATFRSAALDSLFERHGGLISFFHQHFKEAVEHCLLGSSTPDTGPPKLSQPVQVEYDPNRALNPNAKALPSRQEYHRYLAEYFVPQPHSPRRTEEVLHQLERAGDMDKLVKVLSEPKVFMDMIGKKQFAIRKIDLLRYWKVLSDAGYTPAATYQKMLREFSGNHVALEGSQKEAAVTVTITESEEDELLTHTPIPRIINTPASSTSDLDLAGVEVATSIDSDRRTSCGSGASDVITATHQVVVRRPIEQARLTTGVGQLLSILGHFDDAEKTIILAHQQLSQHYQIDEEYQRLMCGLEEAAGNLYFFQLRKHEAAHWFQKALRTVTELLSDIYDATDLQELYETKGRVLDHLGHMKTYGGNFGEAEKMLAQARRCMEKAHTVTGAALVQYHIGFLRMRKQKFMQAEREFTQALSVMERYHGKSHPRVADILNDMAGLYCNHDHNQSYDPKQAEILYRRALQIRQQCFGPDHLLVATTFFHLGKLLKDQESVPLRSEAITMLRQALDIRTSTLGADHILSCAVRRVLSDLEVVAKVAKLQRPTERRTTDQPYSRLTMHDHDLVSLDKRTQLRSQERHRRVQQAQTTLEEMLDTEQEKGGTDTTTGEGKAEEMISGRMSVSGSSSSNGEDSVVEGNIRNRALDEQGYSLGGVEISAPVQDSEKRVAFSTLESVHPQTESDSHAVMNMTSPLQVHVRRKVQSAGGGGTTSHSNEEEGEESYRTPYPVARPKTAPLRLMNQRHGAMVTRQPQSPIAPQHTDSSRRYNNYSEPRCNSAPFQQRRHHHPRPVSASQVHRRQCYVPGPHTIDVHNAFSAVLGPHSTVYSLMGPPPCPRDNILSNGVMHHSAWYHVPGRYPTIEKPYPTKRIQHRVPSHHRHGFRTTATQSWAGTPAAHRDTDVKQEVRYRTGSEPIISTG